MSCVAVHGPEAMPDLVLPATTDERPRRRAARTRRAVAAAVAVAREHGLRVDEPVVLNDRFSVQVHLAPASVVAGISTWTAELRPDITDWLARKVAVTGTRYPAPRRACTRSAGASPVDLPSA